MAKFRVRVWRCRRVEEEGFVEIEAENAADAVIKSMDLDDPPMSEINSSVEAWDCSVKPEGAENENPIHGDG